MTIIRSFFCCCCCFQLPGVHLRGVYLATLFMQGVETASMANDACGVPLPWVMTNPWIFFDGKLFHFKLKMSTYVPTLRDLCDNQLDIVIKVDRFRKAILEDIEHYLLPAHMGKCAVFFPPLFPSIWLILSIMWLPVLFLWKCIFRSVISCRFCSKYFLATSLRQKCSSLDCKHSTNIEWIIVSLLQFSYSTASATVTFKFAELFQPCFRTKQCKSIH